MRLLFSILGTRGDVQPFVAMAACARARGHEVRICLPARYQAMAQARELSFFADPCDVQAGLGVMDRGLASTHHSLKFAAQLVPSQFRVLLKEASHADAIIAGPQDTTVPSIAQYFDIPYFRVTFQPLLPGNYPPPFVPWQGLPGRVNRLLYDVFDATLGFYLRAPLNEQRARIGLPPIRGIGDYVCDAGHTLLAYSPELSPPDPTWRWPYTSTGYCHLQQTQELDPQLEAFLAAGPPPLYVGFGSMVSHDAARLTGEVLRAIADVGCRALISRGYGELGQGAQLTDKMLRIGDTPHEKLFPRLAGVIHHGGAGTTDTAARAGVPQAIVPFFFDQYYWGAAVQRHGLGPPPISVEKRTAKVFAAAMRRLLEDRIMATRAAAFGEKLRQRDGASLLIHAVERTVHARKNQAS